MTLRHIIDRLLRRRTDLRRPACRLTELEVLDIATRAIGGNTTFYVRDVVQVGDKVEWHIGTATVGSGIVVRINDATGEIIERHRWGVR
jgi:hypothetical protein